jgi:hypothetical protein
METSVAVIDKHYGHPRHQPAAECWQAYLSNDEPPELAFFWPEWAEREFGDDQPKRPPAGSLFRGELGA